MRSITAIAALRAARVTTHTELFGLVNRSMQRWATAWCTRDRLADRATLRRSYSLCANPPGEWRGTDFTKALFQHADFAGVDLQGANFTGAQLKSADLTRANLKEV